MFCDRCGREVCECHWEKKVCPHATSTIIPGKGPHKYASVCATCGKWLKWVGKREKAKEDLRRNDPERFFSLYGYR